MQAFVSPQLVVYYQARDSHRDPLPHGMTASSAHMPPLYLESCLWSSRAQWLLVQFGRPGGPRFNQLPSHPKHNLITAGGTPSKFVLEGAQLNQLPSHPNTTNMLPSFFGAYQQRTHATPQISYSY